MEETAERVYLGLGSNLGDRRGNVLRALELIGKLPGTRVERVSMLLETQPWGITDQPAFINAAAEIRTGLEPLDLLRAVKSIEEEIGREPTYRWGPRVIDIDVLLYGQLEVDEAGLRIPHPHILERPFVVQPLTEIAPEVVEELRRAAVSIRSDGPHGE
jgi:2-amino-4-hydroxy-6-hydroxymethyldihydropteridine diphosphokinase